ncbi:uncharacterized protein LOC102804375 [Saccoglossus kowalevskii]|uniref:Uncharacterized protein LOC102804375 n=1 Tax=Saccoglossus kowalevskii TaxID=10224 RepID=A0ABM0MHU6_SACKO|nr:PREDICTED: uncharacterized protein LOC102804375 [Saccoglossus kowalevskii]
MKGRILIYSIVGCPHCMRAKSTLHELNLTYVDVSIDNYPDSVREEVKERTGKTSVPQIFFNAKHIGGNAELQELVKDKTQLDTLIDDVTNNEVPPDAPQLPDPSLMKNPEIGNLDFTCELDEYALLVRDLKASGLIKDHRSGLRVHKQSFIGKEFVDWMVQTKRVDRAKGVEMGQNLLEHHFGHHVKDSVNEFRDDNTHYRLMEDDESSALNAGLSSECEPRPATELSEYLRRLILAIYSDFLSSDGKSVDYKGIAESKKFNLYVKTTAELIRLDMNSLKREEKLAFFINIYNALVIHANVKVGPPVNLWQRYKFFNVVSYIIGGHVYSLQDMENGVLRSNRKGVGMLTKPFGAKDPRLQVALEKHEPGIHFALVCGAKSCPPIKTYSADDIDNQLKAAGEAFLESSDGCDVDMSRKEIRLSKIFKWYKEDFGNTKQELVQWIHEHMNDGDKKKQIRELIADRNYKISYMPYDWGVNSK